MKKATGKFIIWLDADDLFIRSDLFDILYERAEKYGYDIIKFKYIYNNGFTLSSGKSYIQFFKKPNVNPIKQPELSNILLSLTKVCAHCLLDLIKIK